MSWSFVPSFTMSNEAPTRFLTHGSSHSGEPTSVEVSVLADGRLELSIQPAASAVLTPEQVAALRVNLGDALTVALQDARSVR